MARRHEPASLGPPQKLAQLQPQRLLLLLVTDVCVRARTRSALSVCARAGVQECSNAFVSGICCSVRVRARTPVLCYVCVCLCVCLCVRACVRACARACVVVVVVVFAHCDGGNVNGFDNTLSTLCYKFALIKLCIKIAQISKCQES